MSKQHHQVTGTEQRGWRIVESADRWSKPLTQWHQFDLAEEVWEKVQYKLGFQHRDFFGCALQAAGIALRRFSRNGRPDVNRARKFLDWLVAEHLEAVFDLLQLVCDERAQGFQEDVGDVQVGHQSPDGCLLASAIRRYTVD